MYFWFLCKQTTTKQKMDRFLKCHTFEVPEEDPRRYLFKDYSIDCDSARYKSFRLYAVAMIMVMSMVTAYQWFWLIRHRNSFGTTGVPDWNSYSLCLAALCKQSHTQRRCQDGPRRRIRLSKYVQTQL